MQQDSEPAVEVQQRKREYSLLLIEDNPGDVVMMREALRENGLPVELQVSRHGEGALHQLQHAAAHGEALPDLILLDLNLPSMHGLEVLAAIKSDPALQQIPVLILTTSTAARDVENSYRLHANSYLTKPMDFSRFVALVRAVHDFWLSLSVPPATTH
ncbi:MAG TPA: response regulator [Nevskiaceae bacterium]|nr:response regulator [Nevskiaceae bacterium]